MNWLVPSLILAAAITGAQSQQPMTLAQPIPTFDSQAKSRLAALAQLGSATHLSILVECGAMEFLQQAVTVDTDGESLGSVISQIVRGPEQYKVRQQGPLLVLYPTHPAQPINRILKLPLGPMKYAGTSMTDLNIQLFMYVQAASGCKGEAFSGGYVTFPLVVPPFSLSSATFDQVIEKVALAPEPTMWVVAPDDGKRGCIDGDKSYWQAGLYNNTPTSNSPPLRASVGPDFVR